MCIHANIIRAGDLPLDCSSVTQYKNMFLTAGKHHSEMVAQNPEDIHLHAVFMFVFKCAGALHWWNMSDEESKMLVQS